MHIRHRLAITSRPVLVLAALSLSAACTPDIDTDPLPEVMQFDPSASPPRVSEPSFAVKSSTTGLLDFSVAGINIPVDCAGQTALPQAQCEFYQWLETLDGFPTATGARTPVSAAVDLTTATPQNLAVVEARSMKAMSDAVVTFDSTANYLQVSPKTAWPANGFVWIGVRGYANGIRAGGKPVVASVPYNLLKRDESLTCGAATPAEIPATCKFLQLLAQQMSVAAAQASLGQLEQLRQATNLLQGWTLLAGIGGIPKAEAAILWGFPIHSGPVIDLNPTAGLAPRFTAADEIHLAVNGALDPATVRAFKLAQQTGSVYLLNLTALAANDVPGGLPLADASYADGEIVIKAAAPLTVGSTYGIVVTRAAKSPAGVALVPPPVSVLLLLRGALVTAGKSNVSSVPDAQAILLEAGRQMLSPLLDAPDFAAVTGLGTPGNGVDRKEIAYLFAFPFTPGAP